MPDVNEEEILAERNRLLENWEAASAGWGRQADRTHDHALPVAVWLVERADPQPGERILELACGPGDTGFMAARRVGAEGLLISSDAAEGMLDVARERSREQGVENVEFKQLQLEWIDMPTADVDAILCRWGVMLTVDPAAALQECRRVLRPGGRLAMAVWDLPEKNPWALISMQSLIALGHAEPPAPGAPGMFALSQPGRLSQMLEDAGFVESVVESVEISRSYESAADMLGETLDLNRNFGVLWARLHDEQRRELRAEIESRVQPFIDETGRITFSGSSLVALAFA